MHQGILDDWIQALRADVAGRVLTEQIARRIVETALGPDAPCPLVRFPNLTPAEMEARRALIGTLISGGVVAPDEGWLRAYLGIPARAIDVNKNGGGNADDAA